MAKKTSRRLRRTARIAAGLLAATVLLIVGGTLALPRLVSLEINRSLSGHWPGRAELRWAWLDFSGSLHLSDLTVKDTRSRTWLHAPSARVKLKWTGLKPSVSELDMSHPVCQLHLTHGRLDVELPNLREPAPVSLKTPPLVHLSDLQVALVSDHGAEFQIPHLFLVALPTDERYSITLRQETGSENSPPLSARCQFDLAQKAAEGQLDWQHTFTAQECQALLEAFGGEDFSSEGGSISASAHWGGPIDAPGQVHHAASLDVSWGQIRHGQDTVANELRFCARVQDGHGQMKQAVLIAPPGSLRWQLADLDYDLNAGWVRLRVPFGRVELARTARSGGFWNQNVFAGYDFSGWGSFSGSMDFDRGRMTPLAGYIRSDEGTFDLTAPAPANQNLHLAEITWQQLVLANQRVELVGLKGQLLDGTFNANASMVDWAKPDTQFELDLDAQKMNLRDVLRLAGKTFSDSKGTLDARTRLAGDLKHIDQATGRLMATVRQADFWTVPIIGSVFRSLGWPAELTGLSNARFVFLLGRPDVKIVHGLIGTHLGGIEVLRGQYDPRTDTVDADIVGTTFMSALPVTRAIISAIGKHLLLQHVHGRLSEPQGLTFTSLPPSEIPRNSLALLGDLALSGGHIGGSLLQLLESMYNSLRPITP